MTKFVVFDIVFYGNSLNYDQGSGNIQELKKITKWDGKQYTLVSRYALRYSILHHANYLFEEKWMLAGRTNLNNNNGVVQATGDANDLIRLPEFDLFGYMMTETGAAANTRSAPAAISHAVSLTPFNYDSHFNANLDVARRSTNVTAINPFTMEEHYAYYVYSIVVDLNRIGKIDDGDNVLTHEQKADRISQLFQTICSLKRQIKGRSEDLSPKIMVVGLYENTPYDSFKDRIALVNEYQEEITQTEEPVKDGTKIIRRTVKTNSPVFEIYGLNIDEKKTMAEIKTVVENFVKTEENKNLKSIFLYKVDEINVRDSKKK